jgi:hypothetical protein
MQNEHYRHTQVGWVIIGSLAATVAFFSVIMAAVELSGLLAIVVAVLLLVIVLFGTLTVQVDSQRIRFRFGVGLIRRHIDLTDVRHFSQVKNPWYYGWGVHVFPGGVVYNVSGFSAVQLVLKDGKRVRIGTDEPDALCQAIERVAGKPEPLSPEEVAQGRRAARRTLILIATVAIAVVALIGGLFHLEERPPRISITASSFRVKSLFYSEEFDMHDVTDISLEWRIPRIRARTNGYAMGSTLRGHFKLDDLGKGQLFIELGVPPYVLVRRGSDFVIVNFEDPVETQRLFNRLWKNWPGGRAQ